MTPPNVPPADEQPDEPRPVEAEPDDARPDPPAPRWVRCPMLACGRLHELPEDW